MLNFSFSLTVDPAKPQQAILTDTTNWAGSVPARSDVALVVGAELLSPWQAQALAPEMGLTGYNPKTFLTAAGTPIVLTRPSDGVLRVIVCVVPVVAAANIAALAPTTGYCTAAGLALVRGTGDPSTDVPLEPRAVLGEAAASAPPLVLAFATQYLLWNQGLLDALAHLNLRYLGLPYAQQQPFMHLYDRAQLISDGVLELVRQLRYLDAAAVLEGGRKLLVTNGQTPDAYAPLLVGYTPPPAVR